MKCCIDCNYSYESDYGQLLCRRLQNSNGYDVRVSRTGHCDHFWEKDTVENSGYTDGSSGSFCFLTSACVKYYGKADDCEELTKLRNFRDNQLRKSFEGEKLIEEYYKIAPKIVERIEASDKKKEYYEFIYHQIKECLWLIDRGNYVQAVDVYRNMVMKLKEKL